MLFCSYSDICWLWRAKLLHNLELTKLVTVWWSMMANMRVKRCFIFTCTFSLVARWAGRLVNKVPLYHQLIDWHISLMVNVAPTLKITLVFVDFLVSFGLLHNFLAIEISLCILYSPLLSLTYLSEKLNCLILWVNVIRCSCWLHWYLVLVWDWRGCWNWRLSCCKLSLLSLWNERDCSCMHTHTQLFCGQFSGLPELDNSSSRSLLKSTTLRGRGQYFCIALDAV